MGIRFRCHHCEFELHVKDFQGGRRGRCPECKGKFRVPVSDAEYSLAFDDESEEQPTSANASGGSATPAADANALKGATSQTTAAEEVAAATQPPAPSIPTPPAEPTQPQQLLQNPQAQWFVRPASGGQFGPAPSGSMWLWLCENRVGRDSLVWCEGWPEWLIAAEVFADHFGPEVPAGAPETNAANQLSGSAATSGGSAVGSAVDPARSGQAAELANQPLSASLGEHHRAIRKKKRRRNYAVMIAVLSVVMLVLVATLIVVLLQQQS